MRARLLGALWVLGLLASLHSLTAWSQSGFPSKPVKIIVPATPGGTSDIFARAIANKLQDSLGKPVVVEYKPGAATNIGTDLVAKSAPDGHTLLINGITLATNPLLFANLPFNPARDFAPIIEVAEMLNVVTVHPSVPVNNMRELVQLIKSQPGVFNHGTPGVGSSGFLSAELLAVKTGAKITQGPGRDFGQTLTPAARCAHGGRGDGAARLRVGGLVWFAGPFAHAPRGGGALACRDPQGLERPIGDRGDPDRRRQRGWGQLSTI